MEQRQTEVIEGEAKEVGPSVNSPLLNPIAGTLPQVPWFNTVSGLQVNYQITQIMLNGRGASVVTVRKRLQDGIVTEERLEMLAGPQLYLHAVEQIQRQTEQMIKNMLSPWLGMMGSLGHLHTRDNDK